MNELARFVHIGTMGECPAGEDFFAVEDGVLERRIVRRMLGNLDSRHVQHELAEARASSSTVPRLIEVGYGRETRLCAVFEAFARMPWLLWRPRHRGEAAFLALAVAAVALRGRADDEALAGYTAGTIDVRFLELDLHAAVHLRSLWPPVVASTRWTRAPPSGEEALMHDVRTLLGAWGFGRIDEVRWRELANELQHFATAVMPARWRQPLIGDARGMLDVLTDADHKEADRVMAALRLSCVPALAEETCRLLVRALNEPLKELPFLARDLLADRMVPVCVFVDPSTGLLRRCPHPWVSTEIVNELGDSAVERLCPDCDARVTLPQTIETFHGRSPIADAFYEHGRSPLYP